MPLDPVIRQLLDLTAGQPSVSDLDPRAARAVMLARSRAKPLKPTPGVVSEDMSIELADRNIGTRLYRPATAPSGLMLFYHGSGFVIFDLETHDELCRHLCASSGWAVLSVDYRLAPEHKFPAAVEDCFEIAAIVVAEGIAGLDDARRLPIVVAGDSAGGNLAAVTGLRMRDNGMPLAGQILIYPVTDHYKSARPSYQDNSTGYGMSSADMRWFWDHYLNGVEEASDWRAAPILADPRGLPPTLVIVAEYDVLRDEGAAYADCLRSHDVDVEYAHYAGMNHGFIRNIGVVPGADIAIAACADWLKRKVSSAPQGATPELASGGKS